MKTEGFIIVFLLKIALADSIEIPDTLRPKFRGDWHDTANTFDFQAVINRIEKNKIIANQSKMDKPLIAVCFLLLVFTWYFSRSWLQALIRSTTLLVFITSCLWIKVYHSKNAEMPPECHPDRMTLLQSMKTLFTNIFSIRDDPCLHYQHFVNSFWEVNPLIVISETINQMLLHLLSLTREYFSSFFRNFWLAIAFLVIFIVLVMHFKYRTKLLFFIRTNEPTEPNLTTNCSIENQPPISSITSIANEILISLNLSLIGKKTPLLAISQVPSQTLPNETFTSQPETDETIQENIESENSLYYKLESHLFEECTARIDDEPNAEKNNCDMSFTGSAGHLDVITIITKSYNVETDAYTCSSAERKNNTERFQRKYYIYCAIGV